MSKKIYITGLIIVIVIAIAVTLGVRSKESSVVRIGTLMPLSGPSASLGEWMQKGALSARDEINASGGINGKPLELVIEDDRCDGKVGVSAYKKFYSVDGIHYFAGPLCAAARMPVLKSAENDSALIITTGLAMTHGQNSTARTFNVLPSVSSVTNKVIDYSFVNLKTKKISLLKVNDEVGTETEFAFIENLKDRGITNPHIETFTKGTTDMRAELAKIMNDDSDTVFLAGFQSDNNVFMKQATDLGLKKTILTLSSIQTPVSATNNKGTGLALYYAHPSATESASARAFLAEYQKIDPSASIMSPVYLGSGYDAVMLLAKAIKQCGDDVTCSQAYISKLTDYPGANGSITFGEKGNVNSTEAIEIRVLKDGAFSKVM